MPRAIRWGDNDRYLGPFTFSRDGRYRPLALVLASGCEEYRGCRLRLSAFGLTIIAALPPILKPSMNKVQARYWDEATIARQGRDWYWDIHPREYGVSYSEGFLQVFLGRQTGDSSTTQDWCAHLPWTQWRTVRETFYDLAGELFWSHSGERRRGKLSNAAWSNQWTVRRAIQEAVPVARFDFDDFDGQRICATTKIHEAEMRFGRGAFKWLSLFRKRRVSRSLDIRFSAETGREKGSWKGGTVGHSITMEPGELHEAAFRRYCDQHAMTFVGVAGSADHAGGR